MFARKISTGIAAVAVSLSALALGVGPASAAGNPSDADDTAGSPAAISLTGVGSDTSQHALKLLADAYNQTAASAAAPLFTYAATSGGTVSLKDNSTINRPNGSGAGKTLLYNPSNANINFARSSSAESTAEANAGLQSFPFAVDTLVTAVSGNTTSNAPASLSAAQLVSIYQCQTTARTWNQVGGTSNATIVPYLPQAGSGTRAFFLAQLTAANGGVAIDGTATCIQTTQEQDPTDIQGNANAVVPFSRGRAALTNGAVRTEGGFSAQRALYNVVRGADVTNAGVQAAFGSNGYICSAAAKQYIVAAGFDQLLTPSQGGVCGAATQSATSNFTTAQVATSTSVAVSSATTATATAAKIVATVSGSTAPQGTVSFYEGSTLLATVPLTSGSATRTQPAAVGAHTYRAVFNPSANSAFISSEGTGSGTVSATPTVTPVKPVSQGGGNDGKAKAKLREGFKPTYVFGHVIKAKVTVGLGGTAKKSSGKVKVLLGKKVVGQGKLKSSKAVITLKHLKLGKNKLTLVWGGNKFGKAGKHTFTIVVVRS